MPLPKKREGNEIQQQAENVKIVCLFEREKKSLIVHLSVEIFTVLNEAEKKKGERLKRQALKPYPIFVFFFMSAKK